MRTLLLLLLTACGAPDAPAPAPAPVPPVHAEATEHHHHAKHGGEVKMAGDHHVEALFAPDGVHLWLEDAQEQPLDPASVTATAMVNGPGGAASTPTMVMGDALHAPATFETGKPASAVITLTLDGKPVSVAFDTPAVGLAAHEHMALHGGTVAMWGPYHVEYAPADGEYRFYVTGATRTVLTEAVSGTVTDGTAELPLAYDAATGLLSAKAEGAGARPVKVNLHVGDNAFSYPFDPKK